MTRKKQQPARELSAAETFYIDGHAAKESAEKIAADIHVPVAMVEERIRQNPPPVDNSIASFSVHSTGAVTNNGTQSRIGDEHTRNHAGNQAGSKYKDCLFSPRTGKKK